MKYDWSRSEGVSKVLAVLVASTTVYLAFNAFCGVCLPVGRSTAVAIGILGGFPVWVATMCYSVLARSAVRAWLVPLVVALVFGGCAALTRAAG